MEVSLCIKAYLWPAIDGKGSWNPSVHQRHRHGTKLASGRIVNHFISIFLPFLLLVRSYIPQELNHGSRYYCTSKTKKLHLPISSTLSIEIIDRLMNFHTDDLE